MTLHIESILQTVGEQTLEIKNLQRILNERAAQMVSQRAALGKVRELLTNVTLLYDGLNDDPLEGHEDTRRIIDQMFEQAREIEAAIDIINQPAQGDSP